MKILGLSGKKQSGKNTAANFILGTYLVHYGIVRGSFAVMPDGQLAISDIYGDESAQGILNQDASSSDMYAWYEENIWPYVKCYSFADPLKQLCMQILGLLYEQCYGTDNDKNTVTSLKWENMPKCRTDKRSPQKTGFMTAREVMQYVGTDIFRKMDNDVWVNATMRQIEIEQPELAIVTDVRFPNEVSGIKNRGGKVIRLKRAPFTDDEHASEKVLDKENYDWSNFDGIIHNEDSKIADQNKELYELLSPWGYIPAEVTN